MLANNSVSALRTWFETNKRSLKLQTLLEDSERTRESKIVFDNILFDFSKDHINRDVLNHF